MRRKLVLRSLLLVTLVGALLAATPPGCNTFSNMCGCTGSLMSARNASGYQNVFSIQCPNATQGWIDLYRMDPAGSERHVDYCPFWTGAGWIPASCTMQDYTAFSDWYRGFVGVNDGSCSIVFDVYSDV